MAYGVYGTSLHNATDASSTQLHVEQKNSSVCFWTYSV